MRIHELLYGLSEDAPPTQPTATSAPATLNANDAYLNAQPALPGPRPENMVMHLNQPTPMAPETTIMHRNAPPTSFPTPIAPGFDRQSGSATEPSNALHGVRSGHQSRWVVWWSP